MVLEEEKTKTQSGKLYSEYLKVETILNR